MDTGGRPGTVQGQSGWRDFSREAQGTDKATELGNCQLVDIQRLGVVADGKAGPQKFNVELLRIRQRKELKPGTQIGICASVWTAAFFTTARGGSQVSVGR